MRLAGISAAAKAALSVVLVGLLQAQATRLYGGGGWFWVQYSGFTGLGPVVDELRAQGLSFGWIFVPLSYAARWNVLGC
jgi:hypothetical protein